MNSRITGSPHPQLTIGRSIAPSNLWHWMVVMPGGQIFDASAASFGSAELCMADASVAGLACLRLAEAALSDHKELWLLDKLVTSIDKDAKD